MRSSPRRRAGRCRRDRGGGPGCGRPPAPHRSGRGSRAKPRSWDSSANAPGFRSDRQTVRCRRGSAYRAKRDIPRRSAVGAAGASTPAGGPMHGSRVVDTTWDSAENPHPAAIARRKTGVLPDALWRLPSPGGRGRPLPPRASGGRWPRKRPDEGRRDSIGSAGALSVRDDARVRAVVSGGSHSL